jgi:hypothetical protein
LYLGHSSTTQSIPQAADPQYSGNHSAQRKEYSVVIFAVIGGGEFVNNYFNIWLHLSVFYLFFLFNNEAIRSCSSHKASKDMMNNELAGKEVAMGQRDILSLDLLARLRNSTKSLSEDNRGCGIDSN